MDEHLKTGATGEELACRYLESLGYTIHERNWRYGHLEIDIIAQWGGTLVIAEVKTRSSGSYLRARDSVTSDKERFLIRAADHYVRQRALELEVRYDLLAIDIAPDRTYSIEHIPNAFYPNLRRGSAPRRRRTTPHK